MSTPERLEVAFAEAVASGDIEAAQGWLATARYVHERDAERRERNGRRSDRVRVVR